MPEHLVNQPLQGTDAQGQATPFPVGGMLFERSTNLNASEVVVTPWFDHWRCM